jgi:hypothetical protein
MSDEKKTSTVPEDIVKELGRLGKQANLERDEIVKQYKGVFTQPYMESMEEDARHKYALMILKGQLLSRLTSNARAFRGQVIDWSTPRKQTPKDGGEPYLIANLYMRLKPDEAKDAAEEDYSFGEITMWRDQTGLLGSLERGKWYDCAFTGNMKDGKWRLNSHETTNFIPIENVNGEMPVTNFIDMMFERVTLADFDANLSKGQASNPDYKLAVGTVVSQRRGYKESGPYGVMTLSDETLDLDRAKDGDKSHQGMTCWASPDQAIYPKGSIVQLVGRFNKKDNGDRSINVRCVNPIIVVGDLDNAPIGPTNGSGTSGATKPGSPPPDDKAALDLDDL